MEQPRYDATQNKYVRGQDLTLVAPAAHTVTFTGPAQNCAEYGEGDFTLTVTAKAGTAPTLDVQLQTRAYGGAWANVGAAFTQKTDAGAQTLTVDGFRDEVQAVCTIGGSAGQSVTFGVTGAVK
jgi:hypothetical protein